MGYEEMSNEDLHLLVKERLGGLDIGEIDEFNREIAIGFLRTSDDNRRTSERE